MHAEGSADEGGDEDSPPVFMCVSGNHLMKPYSLHTQETLNDTARVYKSRFHRSYSEKQATTNPEREKRVSDLPLIIDVVLQTIKFSRYKTHRTIEPQEENPLLNHPSLP